MFKSILPLLLIGAFAKPKVIYDQSVFEKKPDINKGRLYDSIIQKMDQIGEIDEEEKLGDKLIFIERVTSLLSWKSKEHGLKLDSGNFLILAPKKKNLSKGIEEDSYKDFFKSDHYATGFLYKKYIITNYHVCRGLNTIVRDYENNIYGVKVLAFDIKQDICVYEAPREVMNQRNFENHKMELDKTEEAYRIEKIEYEKLSLKENFSMPKKVLQSRLKELEEKLKSSKRDYAKISGIYGEDYIFKIKPDSLKDEWSKKMSFEAFGPKCLSGMSGSPIFNHEGLLGIFWGAETDYSFESRKNSKRAVAFKENYPVCYFIDKSEIDRIIDSIGSEKR